MCRRAHALQLGRAVGDELELEAHVLRRGGGEPGAERGLERAGLPFWDIEHVGYRAELGKVLRARDDDSEDATGAEHAGELSRVARREDDSDGIGDGVPDGERSMDIRNEPVDITAAAYRACA